jgi:hypothetical protein
MTAHLSTLVAFGLALVAPAASAQVPQPPPAARPASTVAPAPPVPTPPSLADTLQGQARDAFGAARLLLANNDFQGALIKFQQAYSLSNDPRLLYNMAVCNKNIRAYARMQTLLEQYQREAGASMTPEEQTLVRSALASIKDMGLVGTVKLTIHPDGATVLVDGSPVGTAPLREPILVDLGKHTLTVRKDGFEPTDAPLDIAGGNVAELTFSLTATTHLASLGVTADDDAIVMVDGSRVAKGRYQGRLPTGKHVVHVTEAGKVPFDFEVELRDGETRTLDVTLREEQKKLVWPWVVGGVVVGAGLVVGGYFLLAPSSTTIVPVPAGNLTPGSVTLKGWRSR